LPLRVSSSGMSMTATSAHGVELSVLVLIKARYAHIAVGCHVLFLLSFPVFRVYSKNLSQNEIKRSILQICNRHNRSKQNAKQKHRLTLSYIFAILLPR
jgi:dolichol kinase